MKLRYPILSCLLLLTAVPVVAQLDPIYAQYLNNPVLLNPAYAGINNRFSAVATFRKQWAGFDGSPTTYGVAAHSSVWNNKVGVGFSGIVDQIGDTRNTEFNTMYSYKLELGENSGDKVLSFGLQAGAINFRNDAASVNARDPNDPSFAYVNEFRFNFGAGAILKTERFFIGFSVPRMIPATVGQPGQSIQVYSRNFYLMGSYMIYLSEYVRLKPSVLLKATQGAPVSADININVNFEQRYTIGVLTRNLNTYGFLTQINVKDFRFGYVFELPSNNSVGSAFSSHEIAVTMSTAIFNFHSRTFSNF